MQDAARPRLRFREPCPADLAFVTDLFARPETVAHRPDPTPDSPEASAERLRQDIRHWQTHGFGRWAVLEEGRLAGFGGLTHVSDGSGLNLSYHVHPDFAGRGLGTRIAAHAVGFGFGVLGARRIRALIREWNPASRRVAEKLGFGFEGMVELHGAPIMMFALYPGGPAPAPTGPASAPRR